MALPFGLLVMDKKLVCLLERSVYGLKQSAQMWYDRCHYFLLDIGFVSTTTDSSIYILHKDSNSLILALCVDDTVIASSSSPLS